MHKKKWSKGFKKLVSIGAVTVMLVPSTVQAATASTEKSKDIISNYETISDRSNIVINKIDPNINLQSNEDVSVIVEFNSPALAQAKSLNKNQKSIQNDISKEHTEFKNF